MIISICIHQTIARGESSVRFQKPRVNVLESGAATLPDEHGPAILQRSHAHVFLVASPLLIDSKHPEVGQPVGIDPAGADSKPVTISHIVLPNHIPTVDPQADLRINLVPRKISCDRVFATQRSIGVFRQNCGRNSGK